MGSDEPLVALRPRNGEKESRYHGFDGLCDVLKNEKSPDTSLIKTVSAVQALRDTIMTDKNVHLICLGPLTNIALLLKAHPCVRDKIKEITIMGGNRHGVGNITRAAEFNFHCDPEAAFIVFQTARCPIKLLPLETVRQSVPIIKTWRFCVLGKLGKKITKLLDPVEMKALGEREFWTPFDAYAMASFVAPEIVKKTENFHMTIELGGFFTRGQTVIDHIGRESCKNVTVIEEIDVEMFKELMLKVVTDAPY